MQAGRVRYDHILILVVNNRMYMGGAYGFYFFRDSFSTVI